LAFRIGNSLFPCPEHDIIPHGHGSIVLSQFDLALGTAVDKDLEAWNTEGDGSQAAAAEKRAEKEEKQKLDLIFVNCSTLHWS
jgi:hypothetical protein